MGEAVGPLIVVAALFLFWLIWLNASSVYGGWGRLARSYRTSEAFDGDMWWHLSGWVGRNYYRGLIVGGNTEGLRIAIDVVFRPWHPPLFFPWRDVSVTYERRWLFFRMARIRLSREPSVPVYLPEQLTQQIVEDFS
jgi:hypothetical protein